MDGVSKTYTSLHRNLAQADLDFLIFVQRNKTDPALCNLPIKKLETAFLHPLILQKKDGVTCSASVSIMIFNDETDEFR